jgi:hypothetical protein
MRRRSENSGEPSRDSTVKLAKLAKTQSQKFSRNQKHAACVKHIYLEITNYQRKVHLYSARRKTRHYVIPIHAKQILVSNQVTGKVPF